MSYKGRYVIQHNQPTNKAASIWVNERVTCYLVDVCNILALNLLQFK